LFCALSCGLVSLILTLTRLVVVFIFVNFSFALFTPPLGDYQYAVWSGHVSAPDSRLALIKAWIFFVPEFRDPAMSGLDPTQRGPHPILGVRFAPVGVLDFTRRSGLYV
jgi:hypothetical protein